VTQDKEGRPKRGMIIGYVVGLLLAAVLVVIFYNRVQQPAVSAKPAQPPRATQK
jgi:hypothetical protein